MVVGRGRNGASMSLILVLALQAAEPMPGKAEMDDFDLKTFEPAEAPPPRLGGPVVNRCAEVAPGEILVCGNRGGAKQYRIQPLPPGYSSESGGLPKAEMGLGGGMTGRVYLDSVPMPDGTVSKRLLIGIGTKF
jgi:hypothetical protein